MIFQTNFVFFTFVLHFLKIHLTSNPDVETRIHNALRDEFQNFYTALETNKREILSNVNSEINKSHLDNTIQYSELLSQINSIEKNQNVANPCVISTAPNIIFPGTDTDFNELLPVIVKSSKCGYCCTCKKNGMCMYNTYKILLNILSKYPSWSPPSSKDINNIIKNNDMVLSLNKLLKDVLSDISKNKDNSCVVYIMWMTNANIKHLLNPLVLASFKIPAKDSGPNIPLLMALSGKGFSNANNNGSSGFGGINPMLMMMLAKGNDKNETGFDPTLLMLGSGGKIDPMVLAMMAGSSNDDSGSNLGLLMALLGSNGNNAEKGGATCSNAPQQFSSCSGKKVNQNVSPCVKKATCQKINNSSNNNQSGFDPLLLAAMSGNIDPMMMLILQDMNSNSNTNTGQTTTSGYGRIANAVPASTFVKADEGGSSGYGRIAAVAADSNVNCVNENPIYEYGKNYGRN